MEVFAQRLEMLVEFMSAQMALGGPVVAVLLVLALVGALLVLVKSLQFIWLPWDVRRLRKRLRHWRGGRCVLLKPYGFTLDQVLYYTQEELLAGMSQPLVEARASERAQRALADLGRHLGKLELIAMLAPMLGLLGTVLGMIEAFQAIEQAGDAGASPAELSQGIWKALSTTAYGLGVAIVLQAAASGFRAMTDVAAQRLEGAINRVLAGE